MLKNSVGLFSKDMCKHCNPGELMFASSVCAGYPGKCEDEKL